MNTLWEGVKATAGIVGQAAVQTGKLGKLQAELLLIDREIDSRKRAFGEELYEYVEPLSKHPDFFAANDRMTSTLRGPLLTAQREISALDIKRRKLLERVSANDEKQKTAFVVADNVGGKLANTAKKAGFVSKHAKLKTELSMVEAQIRDFQQVFGLEMFQIFVDLEDIEGWLPTVRDIRSIYDQCRREVEAIVAKRKAKEAEIVKLGGTPMTSTSEASKHSHEHDDTDTPSYFKDAALADAESDNYVSPAATTATASMPAATTYGSTGGIFGGPTAPAPGAVSASAPPSQFTDDPFASSSSATTSQPPSSSQFADPFASSAPPAAAVHDPFAASSSSAPTIAATAAAYNNNDPFASLQQQQQQPSSSFNEQQPMGGMVMGGGGMSGSGAFASSSVPPPPNNDPFAVFDNNSTTSQQQQNDNPMFRY